MPSDADIFPTVGDVVTYLDADGSRRAGYFAGLNPARRRRGQWLIRSAGRIAPATTTSIDPLRVVRVVSNQRKG